MPKREELRVDYRKFHNDEPPAFSSPHTDRVVKTRKEKMGGTVGTYGGKQKYLQDFGGEI